MENDDWVMGALAAQDQYRPLGNDPWTNTMKGSSDLPLDPVVKDDPNSPVVFKTASPHANITEQDLSRGMDIAMATSGGGLSTNPIKAYHSSPHTFDKFDTSRIGTGEGAQVYGHGLYFAENPAVSGRGGQYWEQFQGRFPADETTASEMLLRSDFDRAKAIEQTRSLIAERESKGVSADTLRDSLRLLESDRPVIGPRTYEVDIHADPKQMVDWDKPLHQQPRKVLDIVYPGVNPAELDLNDLRNVLRTEAATKDLAAAGVPGIKYLDEGSRHIPGQVSINRRIMNDPLAPQALRDSAAASLEKWSTMQPTNNYVVFDPKIIDIRKMYGISGLGAGLGAAYGMSDLANQGKYQQQL